MELGPVFYIGLVLIIGYYSGKLANRLHLPRVSGYILAGMLMSPSILHIFPAHFVKSSDIVTDFALAMITYSIGGSLAIQRIKKLGKSIVTITVFEAEMAFLAMIVGFTLILPFFFHVDTTVEFIHVALPLALVIGAMASPTDPTATLAVIHEYSARGPLTTTLLGVAASDDALGIINYSVAIGIASALITGRHLNGFTLAVKPLIDILGSIAVGIAGGFLIVKIAQAIRREGSVITVILGSLFLVFGASHALDLDPLLSTMTAGAIVVNISSNVEKMFEIIEKYYEEMVFTLFFVLSGSHIQIGVLLKAGLLVLAFVALRFMGKAMGVFIGGKLSGTSPNIYRYLWLGLIPQGGIVVGLALATVRRPEFHQYAPLVMNLILGTTALHELLGPIFSKLAIVKAGEIRGKKATPRQKEV